MGGMVTDWRGLVSGPKLGEARGVDLLDPGAVDDDDRGQASDAGRVAPGGEIDQAIGADQEEEVILGTLGVDRAQGIDAVMRAGAAGLELGDLEVGVAGDGDPGHLQAVGHRRPVAPLVRGRAGDHEPEPVQLAGLATLLGQDQVPEVDRVERAAEKPQSHRQKAPAEPLRSPWSAIVHPFSCGQTCRNRVNWQGKTPCSDTVPRYRGFPAAAISTIGPIHEPCQP